MTIYPNNVITVDTSNENDTNDHILTSTLEDMEDAPLSMQTAFSGPAP
jgi:hypothetical protein